MKCPFVVGQKVVCIADDWEVKDHNLPVCGPIYTVRSLVASPAGEVFLLLEEIKNPPQLFLGQLIEPCWDFQCFAPVQTRKTDISIFTKMLNPTSKEVEHA